MHLGINYGCFRYMQYSWAHCPTNRPYIDLSLTSMLNADFATAAVLISFGVLLGKKGGLRPVLRTRLRLGLARPLL